MSFKIVPTKFFFLILLAYQSVSAEIVIDLMAYYTDDTTETFSNLQDIEDQTSKNPKVTDTDTKTLISHAVAAANLAYKNSGLDLKVRLVHTEKVNYSSTNTDEASLDAVTNKTSPFDTVDTLREQYGADMVTLIAPKKRTNGDPSCGFAWTNHNLHMLEDNYYSNHDPKQQGISFVRIGGYVDITTTTTSTGIMTKTSYSYCSNLTLAHELGHNMGLNHSPPQKAKESTKKQKTYSMPAGLGYGVNSKFITVMPYAKYYGKAPPLPMFSSPQVICVPPSPSDKNSYACGDRNVSNAVSVIKQTAPLISAFYPTKVTFDDPKDDPKDRDKMEIDNTAGSDGSGDSEGSVGYLVLAFIFIWCCRLFLISKKNKHTI